MEKEEVTEGAGEQDEKEIIEKTAKNMKGWHPLLTHNFCSLRGWKNWLDRWHNADAEIKLGLLHVGLDITLDHEETHEERICFYLETAYGYNDGYFGQSNYGRYHNGLGYLSAAEIRRKLSKKAWAVLCQKFFKDNDAENPRFPTAWPYLDNPCDCRILDKILWFFQGENSLPPPYAKDHYDVIALNFIIKLAILSFVDLAGCHIHGSRWSNHFEERRHQFMEILWRLGRLDIMLQHWQRVTTDDLEILKSFALRGHYLTRAEDKREFNSIDEAIIATAAGGRHAALVFVQLDAMLKAQKKKDKIEELERQAEEAKQKLEQAKKS